MRSLLRGSEDTDIDVGYKEVEGSCEVALASVAGHPVQTVQCVLTNGG